jgi:hexosaminidase
MGQFPLPLTPIVEFVVLLLIIPSGVRAQRTMLIPQPRELQTESASFHVTSDLQIVLLPGFAERDRWAAESLEGELEQVTQHKFSVSSPAEPPKGPAIILGSFTEETMARLIGERQILTSGIGDQGYVLDVAPNQILVGGKDSDGLFYGVQTLRQLVVDDGGEAVILGAHVRDWPAMIYRGTMVDIARGPVPTQDYLKGIVRTLAEFKLNQLFFYMEDSFPLSGQPIMGVLTDLPARQDWKDLVAYAARYHVEIVPAHNSCGHVHKLLRFELYAPMAEMPHSDLLSPSEARIYSFLEDLYAQMSTVFTSPIYNIGCDETVELGQGKSGALAQREAPGQLYIDNLLRVHDIVRSHNKQAMIWGDIALKHPELLKQLPKDMLVGTWQYTVQTNYDPWLKPFVDNGVKIIICPWVGDTTLMIPDYEQSALNTDRFVNAGKKVGALGMNNSVSNDDGETLYGQNWWSIVYGAAVAWEAGPTPVEDFDSKFDWAFYRNTDHRFVEALRRLSHLNETLRLGGAQRIYDEKYGGADNALFWHDPFTPRGQADALKAIPVASEVRRTAEQAYNILTASAERAKRHRDTLSNLRFTALKLDALGMRYLYMQEIATFYAAALQHQKDNKDLAMGQLSGIQSPDGGRLEDLREYTTRLRELYKDLWLSENRATWLPNILQLYDRQSARWQEMIARFDALHSDLDQGKPLPPPKSLGLLPSSAK